MSNKTYRLTKTVYETVQCTRCGGSGHYSRCERYGTTCFKCQGTGKQLSRLGSKAKERVETLLHSFSDILATEIVVGDLLYLAMTDTKKWWVVKSISEDRGSVTATIDGVTKEFPYFSFNVSRGKSTMSYGVSKTSMITRYTDWPETAKIEVENLKGVMTEWEEVAKKIN